MKLSYNDLIILEPATAPIDKKAVIQNAHDDILLQYSRDLETNPGLIVGEPVRYLVYLEGAGLGEWATKVESAAGYWHGCCLGCCLHQWRQYHTNSSGMLSNTKGKNCYTVPKAVWKIFILSL
jgi:hypothetical protein